MHSAKCTTSEGKSLSKLLAYTFNNLLAAFSISLIAQVFRFSKKNSVAMCST